MAKEYFITKLSFREDEKLIQEVFAYEYDGQTLSDGVYRDRNWMVQKSNEGWMISIMTPNPNEANKWIRGKPFTYANGYFSWEFPLPKYSTKRKTFVSYYHKDDQEYRNKFENLFRDLIVSKSVEDGDINSENSDEYINQLIQKDFLRDTTVLVALVGPKTKCRKHVDWEIAGAISTRVGGNSGLIGILLPSHPDYKTGQYHPGYLPERLSKNIESGYAILIDWTDDRVKMQDWIEAAFKRKSETEKRLTTSIPRMQKNLCE